MPHTTKGPVPGSLAANGDRAFHNTTGQILPFSLEDSNGTLLDTLGKHWNYAQAELRTMYVRCLQLSLSTEELNEVVAQPFNEFPQDFQFALVGAIVSCRPELFVFMVARGVLQ